MEQRNMQERKVLNEQQSQSLNIYLYFPSRIPPKKEFVCHQSHTNSFFLSERQWTAFSPAIMQILKIWGVHLIAVHSIDHAFLNGIYA
jgi:hypothetical protein